MSTQTKILNQSQAIAVRDAMCALNNVSASIGTIEIKARDGEEIKVCERFDGVVMIWLSCRGATHDQELYANQSEFFTAYGIE